MDGEDPGYRHGEVESRLSQIQSVSVQGQQKKEKKKKKKKRSRSRQDIYRALRTRLVRTEIERHA